MFGVGPWEHQLDASTKSVRLRISVIRICKVLNLVNLIPTQARGKILQQQLQIKLFKSCLELLFRKSWKSTRKFSIPEK